MQKKKVRLILPSGTGMPLAPARGEDRTPPQARVYVPKPKEVGSLRNGPAITTQCLVLLYQLSAFRVEFTV